MFVDCSLNAETGSSVHIAGFVDGFDSCYFGGSYSADDHLGCSWGFDNWTVACNDYVTMISDYYEAKHSHARFYCDYWNCNSFVEVGGLVCGCNFDCMDLLSIYLVDLVFEQSRHPLA